MNKKKENESVHYIDVFSINKYFYLYNYDLNKILNFFQKENVQKLSNKETSKNYNDNEFKNKDIRKNKGFVLKFTSTFGVAKFIQDTADKKISSKFYLISFPRKYSTLQVLFGLTLALPSLSEDNRVLTSYDYIPQSLEMHIYEQPLPLQLYNPSFHY